MVKGRAIKSAEVDYGTIFKERDVCGVRFIDQIKEGF